MIKTDKAGEVLLGALSAPYETIMDNAGLSMNPSNMKEGYGCNVEVTKGGFNESTNRRCLFPTHPWSRPAVLWRGALGNLLARCRPSVLRPGQHPLCAPRTVHR